MTLTSGLSSRKNVSGLYLLFEVGIPNLGVWIHFGVPECRILFWGHSVTSGLISRKIIYGGSRSYII